MFRKWYAISFIVKKHNTGNMYECVLVHCKPRELTYVVPKYIGEYKKEYNDGVYVYSISKL